MDYKAKACGKGEFLAVKSFSFKAILCTDQKISSAKGVRPQSRTLFASNSLKTLQKKPMIRPLSSRVLPPNQSLVGKATKKSAKSMKKSFDFEILLRHASQSKFSEKLQKVNEKALKNNLIDPNTLKRRSSYSFLLSLDKINRWAPQILSMDRSEKPLPSGEHSRKKLKINTWIPQPVLLENY